MCDPATAVMLGSTGMKMVGGIVEGKQQEAYYNYAADQANADADYERGMGAVRAEKTRKAGRYAQASMTSGYAASGVNVNEGTPAAVGERLGRDIEEDALTQLLTGQRRGTQLNAQAVGYRGAAKNAMKNAIFGAGSSMLGGTAALMDARTNRSKWITLTQGENARTSRAGGYAPGDIGE